MSEKTYEEGLQEGRVNALEHMLTDHRGRLDNHAARLRILERVVWVLFGAMALIQVAPKIQQFLET